MESTFRYPLLRAVRDEIQRWIDFSRSKQFRPKVRFSIQAGAYEVKTVDNFDELRAVLKLRQRVFLREGLGKWTPGYDVDEYDLLADHLIIRHRESRRIIGTYRLLCSRFTNKFYSQSEFDMREFFFSVRGTFLELGRACVDPDHRNGTIIHLLWKGLGYYIQRVGADYLFGCASIKTMSPRNTAAILHQLARMEGLRDKYAIRPVLDFQMPGLEREYQKYVVDIREDRDLLPPLLLSYLAAGAKVYGRPALDRAFKCIDVMTVLNIMEMNPRFRTKYFEEESLLSAAQF